VSETDFDLVNVRSTRGGASGVGAGPDFETLSVPQRSRTHEWGSKSGVNLEY